MLLLTATNATQGSNPGDFCDTVEGELVVIAAECYVEAHRDDFMRCREGCPARFSGLGTGERTTTATIRDVPISSDDYLLAHIGYAENKGGSSPRSLAVHLAWESVNNAAGIRPGTVVGIAGGKLTTRSEPRLTWRIARVLLPAIGRSLVWARRYERTLEATGNEHQTISL